MERANERERTRTRARARVQGDMEQANGVHITPWPMCDRLIQVLLHLLLSLLFLISLSSLTRASH
jgi:hypothetical protein